MEITGIDPRDITWEETSPVYRVYFWHQPPRLPELEPDIEMGWWCHEHRITGAIDVHEVLTWADQACPTGDHYTLYVEHRSDTGQLGMIQLAGVDPTVAPDSTTTRR